MLPQGLKHSQRGSKEDGQPTRRDRESVLDAFAKTNPHFGYPCEQSERNAVMGRGQLAKTRAHFRLGAPEAAPKRRASVRDPSMKRQPLKDRREEQRYASRFMSRMRPRQRHRSPKTQVTSKTLAAPKPGAEPPFRAPLSTGERPKKTLPGAALNSGPSRQPPVSAPNTEDVQTRESDVSRPVVLPTKTPVIVPLLNHKKRAPILRRRRRTDDDKRASSDEVLETGRRSPLLDGASYIVRPSQQGVREVTPALRTIQPRTPPWRAAKGDDRAQPSSQQSHSPQPLERRAQPHAPQRVERRQQSHSPLPLERRPKHSPPRQRRQQSPSPQPLERRQRSPQPLERGQKPRSPQPLERRRVAPPWPAPTATGAKLRDRDGVVADVPQSRKSPSAGRHRAPGSRSKRSRSRGLRSPSTGQDRRTAARRKKSRSRGFRSPSFGDKGARPRSVPRASPQGLDARHKDQKAPLRQSESFRERERPRDTEKRGNDWRDRARDSREPLRTRGSDLHAERDLERARGSERSREKAARTGDTDVASVVRRLAQIGPADRDRVSGAGVAPQDDARGTWQSPRNLPKSITLSREVPEPLTGLSRSALMLDLSSSGPTVHAHYVDDVLDLLAGDGDEVCWGEPDSLIEIYQHVDDEMPEVAASLRKDVSDVPALRGSICVAVCRHMESWGIGVGSSDRLEAAKLALATQLVLRSKEGSVVNLDAYPTFMDFLEAVKEHGTDGGGVPSRPKKRFKADSDHRPTDGQENVVLPDCLPREVRWEWSSTSTIRSGRCSHPSARG